MSRNFLFLQGVISPFFTRLADTLAHQGHSINHINFCSGDALYWRRHPAISFRNSTDSFGAFLHSILKQLGITDIVLFGDERPLHRIAMTFTRDMGLRAHVFEEGYVRPDWVTLQQDGVNANSGLPRDPAWYLKVAPYLPNEGIVTPIRSQLRARAMQDAIFHLTNLANPIEFPGYRTHRPCNAAVEYAGWAKRFARIPWQVRRTRAFIDELATNKAQYYLLPLQLNGDAQITRHSPYANMSGMLEEVIRSFAQHAPGNSQLVIKNHPLDTGLVNYRRQITALSHRHDLKGRVHYLETGQLPTLLRHALGVVTVNSTVGMAALAHGCPTMALGDAIYALPGLTHQGPLDEFWQSRPPPERGLFLAFRDTLIHLTQINGGFYTDAGIGLAVNNSLSSLTGPSPLDRLLEAHPEIDPAETLQPSASIP